MAITYGNELKVPVWRGLSDAQIDRAASWGRFEYRFLQPVDDEDLVKNARRCVEIACRNGVWRISGQMHKRLGLA